MPDLPGLLRPALGMQPGSGASPAPAAAGGVRPRPSLSRRPLGICWLRKLREAVKPLRGPRLSLGLGRTAGLSPGRLSPSLPLLPQQTFVVQAPKGAGKPVITWRVVTGSWWRPRPVCPTQAPRRLHARPCFASSARPAWGELLLTPVPQHHRPGTSLGPAGWGWRQPRVGVRFKVSIVAVPADPSSSSQWYLRFGVSGGPG